MHPIRAPLCLGQRRRELKRHEALAHHSVELGLRLRAPAAALEQGPAAAHLTAQIRNRIPHEALRRLLVTQAHKLSDTEPAND